MKRSLMAMLLLGALSQASLAEPAPEWAKDAVERLEREGILEGYPESGVEGQRPTGRHELAELLERLDEQRAKKDSEFAPRTELEAIRDDAERTQAETQDLKTRVEATEESTEQLRQRRDKTRRPGL